MISKWQKVYYALKMSVSTCSYVPLVVVQASLLFSCYWYTVDYVLFACSLQAPIHQRSHSDEAQPYPQYPNSSNHLNRVSLRYNHDLLVTNCNKFRGLDLILLNKYFGKLINQQCELLNCQRFGLILLYKYFGKLMN